MGICGLQKFIESGITGAFEQVHLLEIINLYRNEMKKDPVLLVDISSCVTFFEDSMTSGLKNYKRNIEIFINKFTNLGVKMKIIVDGMKPPQKYNNWAKHFQGKVLQLAEIFSSESANHYEIESNQSILLHIALETCMVSDKCEVIRSLYEADTYIAAISEKSPCFAILSQDSDFLFMGNSQYLLSAKHLDLESMITYNYNKNKFAEFLGISPLLLPFFASLCIHTHLYSKDLCSFYKINKIKKYDFIEIAKFVRAFSLEEKIIKNLLKNKNVKGINKNMLWKKIEYFSGTFVEKDLFFTGFTNWDVILNLARNKFTSCQANKKILELLVNRVNFMPPSSWNVLKSSPASALKTFRQKIYGVLFFEYPFSRVRVTEHSFEVFREGCRAKYWVSEVSFKRRFHPGLLSLWSPSCTSEEVKKNKIKVFCQTINENLCPDNLELGCIPKELLFPLLAAYYMRWEMINGNISSSEVKIILIQAIMVNNSKAEEIDEYPEYFHLEAMNLSGWFLETVSHFFFLNSVCGDPFSPAERELEVTNMTSGRNIPIENSLVAEGRLKGSVSTLHGKIKDSPSLEEPIKHFYIYS